MVLDSGALQGMILFLMLFNNYIHLLAELDWRYGLGCHQYADGT